MTATPLQVVSVHLESTSWTPAFFEHLRVRQGEAEPLGFLIPTGSSSQTSPLPWNNIDKIAIAFSEDASIQRNDMSLTSGASINIAFSDFFYDPSTRVATWSLAQPLSAETYRIDLDGNGVGKVIGNFTGAVLDGDWIDGVSAFSTGSGNGAPGGDFEFQFRVLPGDVDSSGSVSASDQASTTLLDGATSTDSLYSPFYDIDGNGVISQSDVDAVAGSVGQSVSSATPLGAFNDVPSAIAIATKKLTSSSVDYLIPLWPAFSDAETPDSSLQFSFVNTNSELFSAVTFNNATGKLTLRAAAGASGRAKITAMAADGGGMTVAQSFYADVNYTDQAPTLTLDLSSYTNNYFHLGGIVSDADDVFEGMYVYLYGAFSARAAVQADGSWGLTIQVDPDHWGWEYAVCADPHGVMSNTESEYVGW